MTTYRYREDGLVVEVPTPPSMTTETVITWTHGEPKRKLTVRDYHSDTYRAAQRQLKPDIGGAQHFEVDERCLASYLAAVNNQALSRSPRNSSYGLGYLNQYNNDSLAKGGTNE